MPINYDDVLTSKWGEADIKADNDVTEAAGAKEQVEYVTDRKAEGEKQWKIIENQIRLRTEQVMQEKLNEAKTMMKHSLYSNDFADVCCNLRDDAANLTLISSRYL